VYDLNNLEHQQNISLFLFGNAYKAHWKSNEFEVFALMKPDFLDSKQQNSNNTTSNKSNNYSSSGNYKSTTTWNKFAKKSVVSAVNNNSTSIINLIYKFLFFLSFLTKLNFNEGTIKVSLSIRADYQLVPLGNAKDVTFCQSNTTKMNETDQTKRCKQLVNLKDAPFCVYHCKDKDKKVGAKSKTASASPFSLIKNKYSMTGGQSPASRFSGSVAQPTPVNVKFAPPIDLSQVIKKTSIVSQAEQRIKMAKTMKEEILLSLTSSISKTASPVLDNIAYKNTRKTDEELLASLVGKEMSTDEIKRARLASQAPTRHQQNSAISKLFTSQTLMPSESNCNGSISSQKMVEYKNKRQQQRQQEEEEEKYKKTESPMTQIESATGLTLDRQKANKIKNQFENNKKNYGLSTITSHKDIIKQLKDKEKSLNAQTDDDQVENKDEPKNDDKKPQLIYPPIESSTNKVKVSTKDLLRKLIGTDSDNTITNKTKFEVEKPMLKKPSIGFDLDLFIGDSKTTKKLMSVENKYTPHSPATATSESLKRKMDQIKSPTQSENDATTPKTDQKSKKLKAIDDILNIKGSQSKAMNDPAKNPHLKAYFDRLEEEDRVSDKLSKTTRREVKVVTCSTCNYTSFSQSDYCRKQGHVIKRHMATQRFKFHLFNSLILI
jgi:hypothetical protein